MSSSLLPNGNNRTPARPVELDPMMGRTLGTPKRVEEEITNAPPPNEEEDTRSTAQRVTEFWYGEANPRDRWKNFGAFSHGSPFRRD